MATATMSSWNSVDQIHTRKQRFVYERIQSSRPPAAAAAPLPPRITGDPVVNDEVKKQDKVCFKWIKGQCRFGDRCWFKHPPTIGDCVDRVAQLHGGHNKAISGIVLHSNSAKLFTGSTDGTLRAWDCNTGKCHNDEHADLGGEVGGVLNEGPWVFAGLLNSVRAFNIDTATDLTLPGGGPVGKVLALAAGNGILFAACQNGDILAWRPCPETSQFIPAAQLKGHSKAVLALAVSGNNRLYSGSYGSTIKVWDLETLQCTQTLTGHTDSVMSLLCWDKFLLSASLDGTIKVWAANQESGELEETYTHKVHQGVLALNHMTVSTADGEDASILLASCNDENSVRLYELPSFKECGKMFSKTAEVRVIQTGPGGLFFTGDGAGNVDVWKWLDKRQPSSSSS